MDDGDDADTDDDTDHDTDDYHDADDTDDDNDHKNDSYTAAGAAPGALAFLVLRCGSFVPVPSFRVPPYVRKACVPKIGFRLKLKIFVYLKSGSALSCALNAYGATKTNEPIFLNFLAAVLKIKIQLGRSLTRRRELRRPSIIGRGKNGVRDHGAMLPCSCGTITCHGMKVNGHIM